MVQETYDRLKADDYSFYHAKQVIFNTENLRYCKYDDEELLFVQRVKVEYENKELKTNGYCCLRCGTLYVNNPKAFIAKTQNSKKQETSLVPKSEPQLPKPNIKNSLIKTELNFCDRENILYICKGIISCKNKNHDIESVTGILENKLGSSVKINANYCKQCEKCFIDYTEYLHYKKLYGAIMGNFRISNNGHWDGLFNNLSEESLLHLCGYTVNQNDDLSTKQRRRILEFLINRKMMSKPEIISHLDFLIRTNGKRKNMTVAVSRWNEDIDWIRNYQLDSQRQVTIGRIKKNY